MKYSVEITETAYNDLDEILSYIVCKLKNKNAAQKLLKDFYCALDILKDFPLSMAKVKNNKNKNYRKFFIGNYIVIYKIEEYRVIILTIRYAPMGLGDNI